MSSEHVPVPPVTEDSQSASLDRRIAELQSQLEHEQSNRESAEARFALMQSESEAQAIVVAGLEDQLLAARRAQEVAETGSRELEERLRTASQDRDREKSLHSKLQARLDGLDVETISGEALVAERSQLRRQLAEASQRVDQLEKYCTRLKTDREQAQRQEAQGRDESKGGSSLLSSRLIELRGQISGLEAEKDALHRARDGLEGQLQQLHEQQESVRRQSQQEQVESLGRENKLKLEVQQLQKEMSEGAFAKLTARQESVENTLREREGELALRAKETEQAGRERRRLEDLLKDKGKALEQLEQQATKLAEKLEKSETRREEAARDLSHTEAAYRAVQAQLEQRFTKRADDQDSTARKGPGPLAAGLAGLFIASLGLLIGQQLGLIPDSQELAEGLEALVSEKQPSGEQVPPPVTDTGSAETPIIPPPAAPMPAPEPVAEVPIPDILPPEPASPPTLASPEAWQSAPDQPIRDELTEGGIRLVGVPGGLFQMGYDRDALAPEETPVHPVRISPFYMSRHEITFAEYDRFARATGRALPDDRGSGRGRQPVINVSWEDARAYTSWLSRQTGKRFRLPSEAEWEYAARAGTESFYWWGYATGSNNANCFDCGSQWDNRSTAPVGSFPSNPFGLQDTAGNVLEWVADCYHDSYQGAPADGSAWTGGACSTRAARGGAFNKPAAAMRASRRSNFAPDARLGFIGFRVVREP